MQCFRKKFPFKVGTTSYIYPVEENNLVYNVHMLADRFDTIQLLFMGKEYLPEVMNDDILGQLKTIKDETGVDYVIHLPMDLNLFDPDHDRVSEASSVIKHIFEKTIDLDVTNYVLHVDRCENFTYPKIELTPKSHQLFERIISRLRESLGDLFQKLCIENTFYDLTYMKDIITRYDCKICFDIGHTVLNNGDIQDFLKNFKDRVALIHLHGVRNGKDHVAVPYMKTSLLKDIIDYLNGYTESVIVEVFDETSLVDSMDYLLMNMETKLKEVLFDETFI